MPFPLPLDESRCSVLETSYEAVESAETATPGRVANDSCKASGAGRSPLEGAAAAPPDTESGVARVFLICGGGALGTGARYLLLFGCLASGFLGLAAARALMRVGVSARGGP